LDTDGCPIHDRSLVAVMGGIPRIDTKYSNAHNMRSAQFCEMVRNRRMKVNANLDEDVHQFASIYASAKGITLSAAIGELIRKAEATPPPAPDIRRSPSGLPCFPPTGKVLTSRMVKEAESEFN
jgi:hypothetical protein